MQVFINGEKHDIRVQTLSDLSAEFGGKDMVTVINGFQTGEAPLKKGDEIFFIPKGRLPPEELLEQMMAARHTPGIHKKLKAGRVAVAGLGGLGSNLSVSLARVGVGKLLLVDFDIVEPSNLNRQSYYISHLGQYKTAALSEQLAQINPYTEIETRTVRITPDNIKTLFQDYDILCEALDRPEEKAMLISGALSLLPDITVVSASGMAGYDTANTIQTKKLMKRLYVCGDDTSEAAPGHGLMAPRVTVCAGHQANVVLRLLTGETDA